VEVESGPWPTTVAEAEEIQRQLRPRVRLDSTLIRPPRTVAGLDVAYQPHGDLVVGAVVVLDAISLDVLETATASGRVAFDYVPGLLAFRELPPLVDALRQLTRKPDVLICDGYGIAHPRRFGLACHLGVLTDRPTIGVAKTPFTTAFTEPGPVRGAHADLHDGGQTLGRVLRSRTNVKPIFVSVGHRIALDQASDLVLSLCPSFRLPETTRMADHLGRVELKALAGSPPAPP
jgi:deoxyribonuclease V